jgi:Tol biopolymer transport system component
MLCAAVALSVAALVLPPFAHAAEPAQVQRIAYGTNLGDALCIADAATRQQACIKLPEPAYIDAMAWSPDGRFVAAVGQTYRTDPTRFVPRLMSADGSALPGTASPAEIIGRDDEGVGAPAWAPDGSYVYAATPTHLLGLEINTGIEKYLATWPAGAGFGTGAVSPDGTKIVVNIVDPNGETVMALFSLADSSVQVIRESGVRGAAFGGAAWSPDGSRILFTSLHDVTLPDGAHALASRIYTISPDGSDEQLLYTGEPTGAFLHARYSPDGSRIALEGFAGGHLDVFVMPASGGDVRNVTNSSLEAREPQWSPDGKTLLYLDATCNCLRAIDIDEPAAEPRDMFQGLAAAWSPVAGPLPAGSEPSLRPVPTTPPGDARPGHGLGDTPAGVIGPNTGTGSSHDDPWDVELAPILLVLGVGSAAFGVLLRRT